MDFESPPILPRHFSTPSALQTVVYLCYALMLTFFPGVLIYELLHSSWPILLTLPLCGMLIGIAGYGYFMLAGTAHEGFHFNLHRNPTYSAAIGVCFSSAIPGFSAIGFASSHWEHHKDTNGPNDPDCQQYTRFRSFWSRVLFARLSANAKYRGTGWAVALGRAKGIFVPPMITASTFRRLAQLNLLMQALWIAAFGVIGWINLSLALCIVVLPLVATVMITGLNPYQEHGETGNTRASCARTRTSWLFTVLMYGTNFHLEHHLYPRVPCWRLLRVHEWLRDSEWRGLQDAIVESRFLKAFSPQLLSAAARYGDVTNTRP